MRIQFACSQRKIIQNHKQNIRELSPIYRNVEYWFHWLDYAENKQNEALQSEDAAAVIINLKVELVQSETIIQPQPSWQ